MSAQWESQELLQPITADSRAARTWKTRRCSRRSTRFGCSASRDRRGAGRSEDPRKPPEWGEIRTRALEALRKSKDLRLLAYLGRRCCGPTGCRRSADTLERGVALARDLLGAVVSAGRRGRDAAAQRAELFRRSDGGGRRSAAGAARQQPAARHGSACATSTSRPGRLQPGDGEARPDEAPIEAAFAEMPLEELQRLQQSVGSGSRR